VRTNRPAIRQRLWRLHSLWIHLYLQSTFTRLRLVGCQTQSDNVVEAGSPTLPSARPSGRAGRGSSQYLTATWFYFYKRQYEERSKELDCIDRTKLLLMFPRSTDLSWCEYASVTPHDSIYTESISRLSLIS